MVKVSVKWGKEKYDDVELDTSQDLQAFRAVLYSITNVPPQKQKILYKGSVLKDETNLEGLKIPDGAALMLMGSAEERKLEEPSSKKTVFIEDLTPDQKAQFLKEKTGEIMPVGLTNMGNTCYMNASLQCLRRINEFKDVVKNFKANTGGDQYAQLASALQRVFIKLETKGDAVTPMEFFSVLSTLIPHFGEMAGKGIYKQQDADECFQGIIDIIFPYLQIQNEEGDKFDLIDYLFRVELETTFKCIENPEEEPQSKSEFIRKLSCIIDNQNNPVNHLAEGIQAGLEEVIEKNSPSLGRLSQYQKTSKLKKLPPYLVIQKIRFLWKKASDSAGSKATKAKILRNVSFPKVLDMYPYCTDDLKKALNAGRDYEKKQDEDSNKANVDKFEAYKKDLEAQGKMLPDDTKELYKKWKEEQKDEEIRKHDETLYRKIGTGLETGNYELIAVLTHKGRTSDSGHYVGWVHARGDDWYKYDDDVVTIVKAEDIMALRGGGDWHMAYYCIYRRIEVA
jgi:ubiquitin carboxyl-terminal hydrolase 14